MAFSGTETDRCEVLVLGNRPGGDPRLRVDRAQLSDLMDAGPLAGLASGGDARLVFYEMPSDKQLRAAASGVIAANFGTTRAFISGGEHQAPPGGCLAGVIRRLAGTSRR
jgi:hypothetical protein